MLSDWERYDAPRDMPKMTSRHSDERWQPSTINVRREVDIDRVVLIRINGFVNGDISVLYSWDWDADRDPGMDWIYPLLRKIGAIQ
jgi:hypothetical protein